MPPVPPLRSIYQHTSKPLNTGATTAAPTTAVNATFYVIYATTNGTTVPFYAQAGGGIAPGTSMVLHTPISTAIPAPTTGNTLGVAPPPTPTVTAVTSAGSTLPAGTYTIAIAYSNGALGNVNSESSVLSPGVTVTTVAGQGIQVNSPPFPQTTPVTLELDVPRLEDWHVTRYAVLVSSQVSTPPVTVYIDSVTQINLLDTTALGAQNSANADLYLRPGQRIIAVWQNVDLGATCTFSVYGEKTS